MKSKIKLPFLFFLTIILTLGLSISLQSILADWVNPGSSPTGTNVPAPINVGTTAQTKSGDFTANKITASNLCIGSSCQTSWPTGGGGGGGGSVWATTSSGHIYNTNSGNVGIANNNPQGLFQVGGSAAGGYTYTGIFTGADPGFMTPRCSCDIDNNFNCGGAFNSATDQGANCYDQYWEIMDDAQYSQRFARSINMTATGLIVTNTGNVGIGTAVPTAKLHVAGSVNLTGALSISGNAGTSGQVLTSQGAGLAPTWAAAGGGPWTTSGNDIFNANAGNVGIGTAAPTQKLDVNGYLRVRSINGEGGTISLDGNNGLTMWVENYNGTFRLINSPWDTQLFSVDQSGNVNTFGSITTNGSLYFRNRGLVKYTIVGTNANVFVNGVAYARNAQVPLGAYSICFVVLESVAEPGGCTCGVDWNGTQWYATGGGYGNMTNTCYVYCIG